jgi:ABC-type bacteriocin/lantibiotic exporter with double-glycine peptidase domain
MSAQTLSRSGPDSVSQAQAPKPWVLFFRANRRALMELAAASMLINVFVLSLPLFSMLVYDKAVCNEIHETQFALTAGVLAAPLSKALPAGDVMGRYRDLSGRRDVLILR